MKMISSIGGTAAVHISIDDAMPLRGVVQRDMIAFIKERYEFLAAPVIQEGVAFMPILNFQAGQFLTNDGKVPIMQLILYPDGDAVAAKDTELAKAILDDLTHELNETMSFNFLPTNSRYLYSSHIVVEFEEDFLRRINALGVIRRVLNENLGDLPGPYNLQRLSYARGVSTDPVAANSITQVIPREFIVERRATSFEMTNRFYCAAPLSMGEHINLLTHIEAAVTNGSN